MPSFKKFIKFLDTIINLTKKDIIYEYYNYLEFDERVALYLGGCKIQINHFFYKPIKYNNYYIILDWSLYKNQYGIYIYI